MIAPQGCGFLAGRHQDDITFLLWDPNLNLHLSQGQSTPCIGDKLIQPLMTGILISWGPINPNRDWVDEFPSPIIWKMSWELFRPDPTFATGRPEWDVDPM